MSVRSRADSCAEDAVGNNGATLVGGTGRDRAFFLRYSGQDQRFAMRFTGPWALSPTEPNPGQGYHLTGVRDAAKGN